MSPLSLASVATLNGLQLLQEMILGRLPHPPMAETMGFVLWEVNEGQAIFSCRIDRHLLNPFGTVHGGLALALLDSAAGCALHTTLPAGTGYTSVETKANYTRPLTAESGVVKAVGQLLSKGRKIATAEAKLFTDDGALVAHGSSTLLILDGAGWSLSQ